MPRLLTVMAHPDDAELLVGGTLFQLRELGWELGIVTMCIGGGQALAALFRRV